MELDESHRKLLDLCDDFFKPITILNAPECAAWSVSSTTRDPVERQADRDSQAPMLEWLFSKHQRQIKQHRGFLDENPIGSDMWTASPLAKVELELGIKRKRGSQ